MNVLQAVIAPLASTGTFFSSVSVSGAHERSLAMIAAGIADVAAIDCITYGLLGRHRPEVLAGTRVIHRTPAVAAPPFITSASTTPEMLSVLLKAIHKGIASLGAQDRSDLGLQAIESGSIDDYAELEQLRQRAERARYFELAQDHSLIERPESGEG